MSSVQFSHSVVSNPQRPHGLQPTRLLHPWDSSGNNGVAMPSSRGSSLTQGWNLCLLSLALAGEFFTTSATWGQTITKLSVQFSSVAQLCPTLCDPMNCSTPGLPVHHHLPEFTQTHIHCEVMPSSHLILCPPLLLLPPIPPSIRVFSNQSTLHMRWPKYWSFSFSISPSEEG